MIIIFRRGTEENWNSSKSIILQKNEIGRLVENGKFKVGDGVSKFSELPFSDTLPEKCFIPEKI